MSVDEGTGLEIYGFEGPNESGEYRCVRCTSELYGPKEYVLTHYAAHLKSDYDAMPGCAVCHEKLLQLQGDPLPPALTEQGALVVEFASGPWICTNEACDLHEVEVSLGGS